MEADVGLSRRTLSRIQRSPLPPAVVVGADINGLNIARAIAAHRVPVIALDSERRRFAGYSGALDLVLRPDFNEPSLVDYLVRLAAALPQQAALFLSMDHHVELISAHGSCLREHYYFAFPEQHAVDELLDKARFAKRAIQEGWPIPRTLILRQPADLSAAEEIGFPVILKPSMKSAAFRERSPAKAFRCPDLESLRTSYNLVSRWIEEVVIQEWVPGGDEQVQFSFHFHDRQLREIACFEGRKIRQYVPECGSTSLATGVAVSEVTALSRLILQATRCVGFGSVEYKRHAETGRFLITEPTVGRTNLQYGVALANGADLISRAYFHLIHRAYPVVERPTHDHKWVILDSDFKAARYWMREGKLTWRQYYASLRGPIVLSVWRLSDYRLHARALGELARMPFRFLWHRLCRLMRRG